MFSQSEDSSSPINLWLSAPIAGLYLRNALTTLVANDRT
jgi:hypothetical protein